MRPPPSHQILLAANGAKDASVRTVVADFFTAFNTIKAECIRCSTRANSSHIEYDQGQFAQEAKQSNVRRRKNQNLSLRL